MAGGGEDLLLKITYQSGLQAKKIQFTSKTLVAEACLIISTKFGEAVPGRAQDYGLIMFGKTCQNGLMRPDLELGMYDLKNNDTLEYTKLINNLRIRMLDDSVKTILADLSLTVQQLLSNICSKIGLINHEEYGLIHETDEQTDNANDVDESEGSTKKRKPELMTDSKMLELQRRVRTDDCMKWLACNKTVLDCSVHENDTLLLRRRLFCNDTNIDTSNPVQLNLLYVQLRNDILIGKHPVPRDKAIELGGLQAKIEFGSVSNLKQSQHFDYKKFLPACFYGGNGIEKALIAEHQKHAAIKDIDAKALYTKTARTLDTYGVTFFLVKEKLQGKNKIKPRLFGIDKTSILRLDENTKQILNKWPLQSVKNLGNNNGVVTLDFAQLEESYIIKSSEDAEIIELLTRYIDIIRKNNKAKEGNAIKETKKSPSIVKRKDMKDIATLVKDEIQRRNKERERIGISFEAQRELSKYIQDILKLFDINDNHLQTKEIMPQLGTDPIAITWRDEKFDAAKQNLQTYLAAMNAAVAHILIGNQPDDPQYEYIKEALSQIEQSLPTVTKQIRFLAALMSDEKDSNKLLETSRNLFAEYKELLSVIKPESITSSKGVLQIVDNIAFESTNLLALLGNDNMQNSNLSSMVLCLVKSVSDEAKNLVEKVETVADDCDNETLKRKMTRSKKLFETASEQLVACTKLVLPTFHNSDCRKKLEASVDEVSKAIAELMKQSEEASSNEQLKTDLKMASETLEEKLQNLLDEIREHTKEQHANIIDDHLIEQVVSATDLLCSATDPNDVIHQTKELSLASTKLIKNIQEIADKKDDHKYKEGLLAIASQIANQMQRVVELAKEYDAHPDDPKLREKLRSAATAVRETVRTITSTAAMRKEIICQLHQSCKNATEAITKCQAVGEYASNYSQNAQSKEQFNHHCKTLNIRYSKIISSMTKANANPEDPSAQFALIESAETIRQIGSDIATSSRNLRTSVNNVEAGHKFHECIRVLNDAITDLHGITTLARKACDGNELESTVTTLKRMQMILHQTIEAYDAEELKPLPGDSSDVCAKAMGIACHNVDTLLVQLLRATEQGNTEYAVIAGRDITMALTELMKSSRGVAVTNQNPDVLINTKALIENAIELIEAVQRNLANPGMREHQISLVNVAEAVQQTLNQTIDCLPGLKKITESGEKIKALEQEFNNTDFKSIPKDYMEGEDIQYNILRRADKLNADCTEVTQMALKPIVLGKASEDCAAAFSDLMKMATQLIGRTTDDSQRQEITNSMRGITMQMHRLMQTMHAVAIDPEQANAKNNLIFTVRNLTEEINALMNMLQQMEPGQIECDSMIRKIGSLRPLLDSADEPLLDKGFYDCMNDIKLKSMELGEAIQGIAKSAQSANPEDIEKSLNQISDSIIPLIEATVHSAYLIGVSNPTSVAPRPAIISQTQLIRAAQTIRQNSDIIRFGGSENVPSREQLTAIGDAINDNIESICKACDTANLNTMNPVAKKQFEKCSTEIEKLKKLCLREIKSLEYNGNVERCSAALESLIDEINSLIEFTGSPEYASVPAKISPQGRSAQDPVLQSGRGVLESGVLMVKAAKALTNQPKDLARIKDLITSSQSISEHINVLKSRMFEAAPGQLQCDLALTSLSTSNRNLNEAIKTIGNQNAGIPADQKHTNLQEYVEQALKIANEALESLEPLNNAAKSNAEDLGHIVTEISEQLIRLINNIVGACSVLENTQHQTLLIDQGKTVVESATQLIKFAKKTGGNPRSKDLHEQLDGHEDNTGTALMELKKTLERLTDKNGVVTGLVEEVSRSTTRISDRRKSIALGGSFVDYQTRMVESANEIINYANKMNANATIDPTKVSELAVELTKHYKQLAQDAIGAASTASTTEIAQRISDYVHTLGQSIVTMLRTSISITPDDEAARTELTNNTRNVNEKVTQVLTALQTGSRGTQACIDAANEITNLISDLETSIKFASAGALQNEDESKEFCDFKKQILQCAQDMTEQMKKLITATTGTPEELAEAAQNSVLTVTQICEAVKNGACALGAEKPETQVMLLTTIRDVASSVADLINVTKNAVGKTIQDPSVNDLSTSAYTMMANVKSLLKIMKSIENSDECGARAIEACIEGITRELRATMTSESAFMNQRVTTNQANVTSKDLLRASTKIRVAVKKAMAAAETNLDKDKIEAANISRRNVSEMFATYKAVALNCADTQAMKKTIWDLAMMTSISYNELLKGILNHCTVEERARLGGIVFQYVSDAIDVSQELSDTEDLNMDEGQPAADQELMETAKNIEATADKLAVLKPRTLSVSEDSEDIQINFDGEILDIAKGIILATAKLIRDASEAQKELIQQGNASGELTGEDNQWSEGLISAAKYVSIATNSLLESAQNVVQGIGSEAMLISAAKQVAGSTAQLLISFKVKADTFSKSGRPLQKSANTVMKATQQLVLTAQNSIKHDDIQFANPGNVVSRVRLELNARSELLKLEKKLETARNQLVEINRSKYQLSEQKTGENINEMIVARSKVTNLEIKVEGAKNKLAAILKATQTDESDAGTVAPLRNALAEEVVNRTSICTQGKRKLSKDFLGNLEHSIKKIVPK